eukprot:Hpha_TRINITY_DN13389_c0_g1::TRINITY_DN13389_c0_g1_i1::g.95400::m.95400
MAAVAPSRSACIPQMILYCPVENFSKKAWTLFASPMFPSVPKRETDWTAVTSLFSGIFLLGFYFTLRSPVALWRGWKGWDTGGKQGAMRKGEQIIKKSKFRRRAAGKAAGG